MAVRPGRENEMSFGEAIVGLFALIVFGVAFFVLWILISSIIGTALGGAIAEVTGTPMFFTIDGAFMLVLGAGIALSKSVRQLD